MTADPQPTSIEADACVIIAQLISVMDKWSRDNLNSVTVAIDFLRAHAPPDLFLAMTVRDMMEEADAE